MGEAAAFPVLLRLLDPLLTGRDEVPPDMARAFQRLAAKKHHARLADGPDRDAVAGPEDQQSRALVAVARYLDFAIDHIDRALLVVGIHRHPASPSHPHLALN